MLSATEFYEVSTPLLVVLWIETVVYLGIGLYQTFDDFIHKTPKWAYINDRLILGYGFRQNRAQNARGDLLYAGVCGLEWRA